MYSFNVNGWRFAGNSRPAIIRQVATGPRLFRLAAEKDRGFTPEMFAEMASRFSRLRPDEFGIDSAQYEQLRRKVADWQERGRSR